MLPKDHKSEGGWRRSGACFLDSLDRVFLEKKRREEKVVMRMPRETTVGELKQKGDRCSLRHNGRMRRYAMPPSLSLPPSFLLSPLSYVLLPPFLQHSPSPLLCHHVPRKSINTGATEWQAWHRQEGQKGASASETWVGHGRGR